MNTKLQISYQSTTGSAHSHVAVIKLLSSQLLAMTLVQHERREMAAVLVLAHHVSMVTCQANNPMPDGNTHRMYLPYRRHW